MGWKPGTGSTVTIAKEVGLRFTAASNPGEGLGEKGHLTWGPIWLLSRIKLQACPSSNLDLSLPNRKTEAREGVYSRGFF